MSNLIRSRGAFAVVSINSNIIYVAAGVGTLLAYGLKWLSGKRREPLAPADPCVLNEHRRRSICCDETPCCDPCAHGARDSHRIVKLESRAQRA